MSTQNGNSMAPNVIGAKFERYVRGCLFVLDHYELLETPPQFTTRKEFFSTSALRPDFKFRDKRTGRQFYVEAKYRTPWRNSTSIRWSYDDQLARYQSFGKEYPTFLILGVGGSPDQPALVTLVPIEWTYVELFKRHIKRFEVVANQAVSPDILWSAYRR